MYETIKCPQVWKPSLYIYISLALSISTQEGQFYWQTDPKAGPGFSQVLYMFSPLKTPRHLFTKTVRSLTRLSCMQEFIGIVHAIGALASIVGVIVYHKALKDYPFRNLLFFAQLFYGISGMLDLIFMLRWNLVLGIPDYLFAVIEGCVSSIISKIRWIPMIVLSTQLCPSGIEGTFFALLMCIDSLGSLSSKWGGGIVLHRLHVTRTDFTNLWLAILIRNILRIATLALIFLVPNDEHNLVPPDTLAKKSADDESLQLVSVDEEIDDL